MVADAETSGASQSIRDTRRAALLLMFGRTRQRIIGPFYLEAQRKPFTVI